MLVFCSVENWVSVSGTVQASSYMSLKGARTGAFLDCTVEHGTDPMPSMDVIHCFTSATRCTYEVSLPGYLRKHICSQALVTYGILCPDKYFVCLCPWVLFGCLSSVNVFLLSILSFYLRVCTACLKHAV